MEKKYSEKDEKLLKSLGKQVRKLRNESGLSQEKLAFASELDRTYIGSVERGERNISIINLHRIAEALKIPVSDLLNFST
jgi:transcriptional regulator with XRE-family HTH domain